MLAILERLEPLSKRNPAGRSAGAEVEVNALLTHAKEVVPDSPLIAAMRPLPASSTLVELVTRLSALRRAVTFV